MQYMKKKKIYSGCHGTDTQIGLSETQAETKMVP